MDIETLKIFSDVIRLRGFTAAATAHSVTQSAVSQRIKCLEKDFGIVLIERKGGIFKLTDAGEIVYKAALQILASTRELEERVRDLRGQGEGSVRVAAIYSIGLYELNPFVKKFLKAFPKTEVQIEYSHCNKIYQDVIDGTVDLGIVAYPVQRPQICVVPFCEDELVLICYPGHPLWGPSSVSLQRLHGEPFVSFQRDVPTRKAIDGIFQKRGIEVKMRAEFDNIELVKRAVEIGLGISLVPSVTVRSEVEANTLKSLPIKEGPFLRPIGILYRRGKSLPKGARSLVATLAEKKLPEIGPRRLSNG